MISTGDISGNPLFGVYESCKLIIETYCDTKILQTTIDIDKAQKICSDAHKIIREIEELHNEFLKDIDT